MRLPQPAIPFRVPPQPVQDLCSSRGGEIDVPYIRYLDGQVPEDYELWAFAEDGVREVHPSARFRFLDDFREDNFHTHFFNAQQFQITLLGCRSVNMSVEFLDAACATQQVGSRVNSWTENIFVHSWGPCPTMIPHTVSTIKRLAYHVPVTPHAIVLQANHEQLQLKRVEWRQTFHRELIC